MPWITIVFLPSSPALSSWLVSSLTTSLFTLDLWNNINSSSWNEDQTLLRPCWPHRQMIVTQGNASQYISIYLFLSFAYHYVLTAYKHWQLFETLHTAPVIDINQHVNDAILVKEVLWVCYLDWTNLQYSILLLVFQMLKWRWLNIAFIIVYRTCF